MLRIEGTLTKWNEDRRFGFITPTQGGQEIFVHASAFPMDGVRPSIGEKLTFEIEIDSSGKKRAKNLSRPHPSPAAGTTPPHRPSSHARKARSPGSFVWVVLLLIALGLGIYGYGAYSSRTAQLPANTDTPVVQEEAASSFRCDGRTHCSQMTSCAEATYFLRHCPNVQMDGNNDGVPCEQQWCTGPLAK